MRALFDQIVGAGLIPIAWLLSMVTLGGLVGCFCRQRAGIAVATTFAASAVLYALMRATIGREWDTPFTDHLTSWVFLTMPALVVALFVASRRRKTPRDVAPTI